ncbi:MAG TPA: penicillin-binding transpeptidase domain-containing protein [Candidatus Paceibacterota bacterium]|nr:penicillin-binding transpeptidase domain-containing protein [Candidatus Paceibacterota bacterium]
MMGWFSRRKRYRGHELNPDEIFLDSSNLPDFDRSRLEGRLEKPLGDGSYLGLMLGAAALFLILVGKAVAVGLIGGEAYAAQSERNRLRPEIVFAERGALTDRNGVVLAANVAGEDGFPVREYRSPGFGHVLGYVSYPKKDSSGNYYETEITGQAGAELAFEERLAGKNGTLLIEENALGDVQSQGSVMPAQNGETIALSIDARVQEAMHTAISSLADQIPYKGGSGVMMDVETGEVIALVSYPEYDPNILSRGSPADVIASYQNNPREPYLDRAVSGLYTPGSIVKPLIAAGIYNDGIIDPETIIVSTGAISVPNPYDPSNPTIFRDWKALGPMNMRSAVAYSSDVYFYTVGGGFGGQRGLGIERLKYWYDAFGLESITGIELEGENSGFVPTPAWKEETYNEPWRIGNTYHTSIGQYAMQITPLEAVRAIAAVANDGKLLRPTILAGGPVEGESIAIDREGLRIAREGMRMGVTEGTSVGLNPLSYVKAAGKTGTAQLGANNEYYNTWMVGFFPYDKPKYAFAVVMERGPAGTTLGGVYVMSQVFTKMRETAPEYFGLPPNE